MLGSKKCRLLLRPKFHDELLWGSIFNARLKIILIWWPKNNVSWSFAIASLMDVKISLPLALYFSLFMIPGNNITLGYIHPFLIQS